MRNNKVIIGGEESGGLSIQGHIPEKDGILANLLLLEAVADSETTLENLHQKTFEYVQCKFYTDRIDLEKDNDSEIFKITEMFKNINELGEYKVSDINLIDGVKLMLGDKAKILVRKSGTEPLLRIYLEADSRENLQELKTSVNKILEEN